MSKLAVRAGSCNPISFARSCVVLLALGLCAHVILILTDYVLWDGHWYHAELAATAGAIGMKRLFSEIGRPLDFLFVWPFTLHSGPALPKLAGLISWTLLPLPMLYVLRRGAGLPPNFSVAVAALAGTLPVFDVLGEISIWMITVCFLLFWCAYATLIYCHRASGLAAWSWRLLALALFFVSFNLNSLLVFYYAIGLFVVVSRLSLTKEKITIGSVVSFCMRYGIFAAAPVLYWLAKSGLTPTYGYYATYNSPVFSMDRFVTGGVALIYFIVGEAKQFISSYWLLGFAVIAALLAAVGDGRKSALQIDSDHTVRQTAVCLLSLGGGFMLLLAAAFPYAAVDQSLASFGWLSRNCVLTAMPISLLICGFCFTINQLLANHRPNAWLVPVALVLVLSVCVSNLNYLRFQGLGAKQDSIAMKLQSAIDQSGAVVVQMRDYFLIPDTIYYYAPVIWTYIAAGDKPTPETFVFDTAQSIPHEERTDESGRTQIMFPQVPVTSQVLDQMLEQTTMPYMLQSIPRSGPQIMFVVQQGKYGNDGVVLGARYLWLKWFNRGALPEFLEGLTITHLLELPNVGPA